MNCIVCGGKVDDNVPLHKSCTKRGMLKKSPLVLERERYLKCECGNDTFRLTYGASRCTHCGRMMKSDNDTLWKENR